MKDFQGCLPLHIAASRHTSPSKLQLLLDANPHSIVERTNNGKTALDLAKATATATHPNFTLIKALATATLNQLNGITLIHNATANNNANADMPNDIIKPHNHPPRIDQITWHNRDEACEKNGIRESQLFKVVHLTDDSVENDFINSETHRDKSKVSLGQSAAARAGGVNNPNLPNCDQGLSGAKQIMKHVEREEHCGSKIILYQAGTGCDSIDDTRRNEDNLEFQQRTNSSRDTAIEDTAPSSLGVKNPEEREEVPGAHKTTKKVSREGQRGRGTNRPAEMIARFDEFADDDKKFAPKKKVPVPSEAQTPDILLFNVTVIDFVDNSESCLCFSICTDTGNDVTLHCIRSALYGNDNVDYEFKFYVPSLGVLSPLLDSWEVHHFFSAGDGSATSPYHITIQKIPK